MSRPLPVSLCLGLWSLFAACEEAPVTTCADAETPGATATCLTPTFPPAHYVAQAQLYFDSLDIDAQREVRPRYAAQVARWEWPPWLLLTGFGVDDMHEVSDSLRNLDPSTVPIRDCRAFATQPFARCYIVFEYDEGPCPIYEEFVFNDEGEITFVEAWSDLPGLRPHGPNDPWGDDADFPRLSTRIPGLGTPTGALDLYGTWMRAAADRDPEVADFAERATDWWSYWAEALRAAPPDFFAQGCGWSSADGAEP